MLIGGSVHSTSTQTETPSLSPFNVSVAWEVFPAKCLLAWKAAGSASTSDRMYSFTPTAEREIACETNEKTFYILADTHANVVPSDGIHVPRDQ